MSPFRRFANLFRGKKAEKKEQDNSRHDTRGRESKVAKYYDIVEVAKNLSAEKPFFRMNTGVYAVKTDSKGNPICFIRVSKKRGLVGKARKKARQADRALVKSRMNMTAAQKEVEANG